jgi:hypothetical protein
MPFKSYVKLVAAFPPDQVMVKLLELIFDAVTFVGFVGEV